MEQSGLSPANPLAAGLRGRCPRCGEGKLFSGYLKLSPACNRCKLDYGFADAGDGPAVFVILAAGFLVVGAALVTEIYWRPPYWVHAALWFPMMLAATLGLLQPFKGVLIALQYRNQAEESRFQKD